MIKTIHNKTLKISIITLIVLIVLSIVSILIFKFAQTNPQNDDPTNSRTTLTVDCNGWTKENISLGFYISGDSGINTQYILDGPGTCELELTNGTYTILPQFPSIMLSNGTVLVIDEPITIQITQFESQNIQIVYRTCDTTLITHEELSYIAHISFRDPQHAETALTNALSLNQGSEKIKDGENNEN